MGQHEGSINLNANRERKMILNITLLNLPEMVLPRVISFIQDLQTTNCWFCLGIFFYSKTLLINLDMYDIDVILFLTATFIIQKKDYIAEKGGKRKFRQNKHVKLAV